MSRQPFALTATAHSTVAAGHTRTLLVRDSGTRPVKLAVTVQSLRQQQGHCTVSPHAVSWVRASRQTLTLRPGQTRTVAVHAARSAPTGTVLVEFTTTQGHGNVQVRAGVATSLGIHGHQAETATACAQVVTPRHAVAAPPGHGGSPDVALGGAAVGLLALAAIIATARRRRRRTLPAGQ